MTRVLPDYDTSSKRLGRAFHAAMEHTSREAWLKHFEIVPTTLEDDAEREAVMLANPKTKQDMTPGTELNRVGKGAHNQYFMMKQAKAQREGRDWVTRDEFQKVIYMIEAVWKNPAARQILEQGGEREQTYLRRCPDTGIGMRALIDVRIPGRHKIDFKTTRAMNRNEFLREVFRQYSIDYQAEWYSRVTDSYDEPFYIITVRNERPFESIVYEFTHKALMKAKGNRQHIKQGLKEGNDYYLWVLEDCLQSDCWQSLGWGGINELEEGKRYAQ